MILRPRRLAHRGFVDAVGLLIDRSSGEREARARVLSRWTPGTAVYALGVRYAIGLAIGAGLARFVPYVGPAINWAALALVTFFQTDRPFFDAQPLYYTLVIFIIALVIDQIFDNIVSPRVMADALKVHPAAVLVAAIISASLLGVLGVVIAAPMLATLQLFGQYTFRKMFDLNPWPEPPAMAEPASPSVWTRIRAWWMSLRSKKSNRK